MATPASQFGSVASSTLRVQVPASSANLGPGFDVLGIALSLYARLEVDPSASGKIDTSGQSADVAMKDVEESHPAVVAYRSAGGRGVLRVQCSIPSGRGLGFSGAVRVGGICLGLAEAAGIGSNDLPAFIESQRHIIVDRASELEGHGDNVAASVYGGVTAVVRRGDGGLETVEIPVSPRLIATCSLAVWVPSFETSTAKSRQTLPASIDRADAVFNIAHAIRLIVALAGDDVGQTSPTDRAHSPLGLSGLRSTLADRLHQDQRLHAAPLSHKALTTMLSAGALTGWLSGSGPTVAALCLSDGLDDVERAIEDDAELRASGRVLSLRIDQAGLQAAR